MPLIRPKGYAKADRSDVGALMEFTIKSGSPEKQRSACVVVGVFDNRKPSLSAELIDRASGGYVSEIIRRGDMEGKLGSTLLLHNVRGTLADRVLLVGLGKERDFREREFRTATRAAWISRAISVTFPATSALRPISPSGRKPWQRSSISAARCSTGRSSRSSRWARSSRSPTAASSHPSSSSSNTTAQARNRSLW